MGPIVAYVSGSWDLFHIGHLRYLKKAKELCDVLVVGINTDEMIASYKSSPPVIPFEQRWAIVESLSCVDVVVPHLSLEDTTGFEEYDVSIRVISTDFEAVERRKEVKRQHKERGITLVRFDRTPDISTTIIKEAIREEKSITDYLVSADSGSSRLPG